MPELPDVEGFRRVLARHAQGRRIERVEVPDRAMLRNASPQAVGRTLRGGRFGAPHRHGKWLIAPVDGVDLLLHFGMTGSLEWARSPAPRHPHDRMVFACVGGELRYRNMRRFGGVWLARTDDERRSVTGPLGPDATALGREDLHALLARRRGGVKAALMDQRLVAGLGNLLVDEILWRARVHPRTPVPRLGARRRDRLYEAMRETLERSLPAGRVPPVEGWLTGARDARDPRCPRCGRGLVKATVAGRTAAWCARCQRP